MDSAVYQPFPMLPGRRAQVWRHQPAHRRPRHFHEEPEINLVMRGRARLGVGATEHTLSAGDFAFFHPGQDHELVEASQDLELFVFALTPELAERVFRCRQPASSAGASFGQAELEGLAPRLLGLGEVAARESVETELASVFELASARMAGGHAATRRALRQVLDDPAASLSEIADRLGTSSSGLSRSFSGDLGVSLVELRSRIRLIRFVRLVDGGVDFLRACNEAGFGSYAQCHRVFRRALGCSPRAYFAGRRFDVDEARCPVIGLSRRD